MGEGSPNLPTRSVDRNVSCGFDQQVVLSLEGAGTRRLPIANRVWAMMARRVFVSPTTRDRGPVRSAPHERRGLFWWWLSPPVPWAQEVG